MKTHIFQWGHFKDGSSLTDFLFDLEWIQNWTAELYEVEELT